MVTKWQNWSKQPKGCLPRGHLLPLHHMSSPLLSSPLLPPPSPLLPSPLFTSLPLPRLHTRGSNHCYQMPCSAAKARQLQSTETGGIQRPLMAHLDSRQSSLNIGAGGSLCSETAPSKGSLVPKHWVHIKPPF